MSQDRASIRYARAVFEHAQDNDVLTAVRDDLKALNALIAASEDLHQFFTNPVLDETRVDSVLKALFESRINGLTYKFLRFLQRRDRLDHIVEICEAFEELYLEHVGIIRVTITSVVPFSDEQLKKLVDSLRERLGKEPEPTVVIDPSLIGGFRVQARDTIYDYSITTQLESLRKRIISA